MSSEPHCVVMKWQTFSSKFIHANPQNTLIKTVTLLINNEKTYQIFTQLGFSNFNFYNSFISDKQLLFGLSSLFIQTLQMALKSWFIE